MSENQTYIACWYPSDKAIEENGARKVAYSFLAAHDKQARAKATLYFMEQFPEADDSEFTLNIYAYADGIPCPDFEIWDDDFLYEHDWNDELGYPEAKTQAKLVEFNKLSKPLRVAVLVKYHTTDITNDQLAETLELHQGDSSSFDSHITEAITKTAAVLEMYPERILEAIDYIREKCPPTKKWPEIKAVIATWLKQHNKERKETSTSLSLVDSARQNAAEEKLRVPSGATAGGGNLTDRGEGFEHDFDSLALDVALGMVARAMDFDIYNLRSSFINRARDIIKLKERPFPALYSAYRNMPGVLNYSRAIIIYSVKTAPDNIEATPGKLTEYLNKTLTETDHVNPDPHMIAVACGLTSEGIDDETKQDSTSHADALADIPAKSGAVGTQQPSENVAAEKLEDEAPIERSGPFYYRTTDGQVGRANKLAKLQAVIAQGCEEITKDEYQSLKMNPPVQQHDTSNHGGGIYSLEELTGEEPQTEEPTPKTEHDESKAKQVELTSRSEALTKELNEKTGDAATNLSIWKRVHKTDPARTKTKITYGSKRDNNGDLEILRVTTSINPTYQEQRATELFGPFGIGWGVNIEEERFDPGIPFMEPVYDASGKFLGKSPIRNADGSIISSVNHTIRINLWYIHNGIQGNIPAYGHTKYIYQTKSGATCDDEFAKKSLTDATTKALSKLGFSADVYTGLFDDVEYKEENAARFDLINASDKAEDVAQTRKELDEKFKANTNSMRSAVTTNEISGIASSLTRVMAIHLKAAREKGDAEYTKYLEGRLHRLEEVKAECLTKLQENAS
ncbi:exodeoxyribonuclease VIII [Serratia fonticola]|uniref:Exodeoxyribonuclease VIII n=1 Tax=Serratia fonticola TaxID=47917 RepID=A0AAW3WXE6_SERFO|nr:exodeoxyribonuclease VIII [Serratia fonticola]MBC3214272.1 exodeoxyribonuclease VIII [Serratia fonticola]NYA13663.1 exodeoxyribonuclease VIII [Serratia fonticola]NYA35123.1 exodeoxyribonuclease VIII [Serratia fonticola]